MDEIYEVDKIIGSRRYNDKLQYLVRWEGYDESEDSWEPEENLKGCLKILESYRSIVNSTNSQNSPRRNEVADNQLLSTPLRKQQSVEENGGKPMTVMPEQVRTFLENSILVNLANAKEIISRQQQITATVNSKQTELHLPTRTHASTEEIQTLDDSLDIEIAKITSTYSKKSNSFSKEYYLQQCLKEVFPLFVFFGAVLIVAFLVPFLPTDLE